MGAAPRAAGRELKEPWRVPGGGAAHEYCTDAAGTYVSGAARASSPRTATQATY